MAGRPRGGESPRIVGGQPWVYGFAFPLEGLHSCRQGWAALLHFGAPNQACHVIAAYQLSVDVLGGERVCTLQHLLVPVSQE